MIALLRKDIYVADKQARLLIVLALIFCLIPNMGAFSSTYALMTAFMIPINSLAYDDKSKWDKYAAMLPYRISELVGSKYLLCVIYTGLAFLIVAVGMAVQGLVVTRTGIDWTELWETELVLIVTMAFIMNLTLPLLYRFGTERGRMLMVLMLGAALGMGLGLVKIAKVLRIPGLPLPAIAAAGAAGAVVLTVASLRLSMRFYKNRREGKYD